MTLHKKIVGFEVPCWKKSCLKSGREIKDHVDRVCPNFCPVLQESVARSVALRRWIDLIYWNDNTKKLFYKIIQIVRALWLAIKPFYMGVCKHGFRSTFISYFIKEMENGWEVGRLGEHSISWKPLRFVSWFPTPISLSPNLPRVYIRLCKHVNHFTFLQYSLLIQNIS